MTGEAVNASTPSSKGLFDALKVEKTASSSAVEYTQNVSEVLQKEVSGGACLGLCGVLFSLLGLALPVTEIVIGALYLHQCSAQRLLPVYLVVAGVFTILSGSGGVGQKIANRGKSDEEESGGAKNKAGSCCSSLIGFFVFIWLICGSAWVFKMEKCDISELTANTTSVDGCFTTDDTYSETDFYCKKLLFDFVYYETIVKWSILAFFLLITTLICCCACCVYCCCSSDDEENQTNASSTELGTPNKSYNDSGA